MKYLDNNDGEFIELVFNYLQEHLKLAEKENNSIYVADCIMAHEMISKAGNDFFKDTRWIQIPLKNFSLTIVMA